MKKTIRLGLTGSLALLCGVLSFSCKEKKTEEADQEVAEVNYLEESREDFDKRMAWWRDARFGMFIHWGPYSVAGGEYKGETVAGWVGAEWIMNDGEIPIKEYEKFSKQFNPTNFDADAYIKLMKDTGMKYMVITSKHHDGFCLWDSKVSDYDIVDFSPYGKDILKQLSEACKKYGIEFGLYHSIMDWHHPQAQAINEPRYNAGEKDSTLYNPEFPKYYEGYLKPQIKELIDTYDPKILWFDGEWIPEYTHEHALDLYQYVRSLKPNIIINNRIDVGREGLMGMNKEGEDYVGDFGTPEKEVLAGTSTFDWESCMTINDTWGYRKSDHDWKPAKTLVHNLIDAAAKGGNYLLNIGPMGDGTIPQPSLDRLEKIGNWVNVNNEAIFNVATLGAHYKEGDNLRFTQKKGKSTYYAIAIEHPGKELKMKTLIPEEGSKVYLLGATEPLSWSYDTETGVTIQVPEQQLKEVGETEAWVFKIKGKTSS
ncbi:MAG: alpha-L-fucosidase [Flavobacteriaceae bacterium]